MKTVPNVNQQLTNVMNAIAVLSAMDTPVTSIMIYSEKPIIRVSRNSPCVSYFKAQQAGCKTFGTDKQGRHQQGGVELYGCKVIWSESLH